MKTLSALAVIDSIRTTLDGGARVSLDFSASDVELVKALVELKLSGSQVIVAFQKPAQDDGAKIAIPEVET